MFQTKGERVLSKMIKRDWQLEPKDKVERQTLELATDVNVYRSLIAITVR